MLRDPNVYKDPERFNLERFLGENLERDPRQMAFGFGRRICPGRLLAYENGVVVEPVHCMSPGIISRPEPYKVDIKPRWAQAIALSRTPGNIDRSDNAINNNEG